MKCCRHVGEMEKTFSTRAEDAFQLQSLIQYGVLPQVQDLAVLADDCLRSRFTVPTDPVSTTPALDVLRLTSLTTETIAAAKLAAPHSELNTQANVTTSHWHRGRYFTTWRHAKGHAVWSFRTAQDPTIRSGHIHEIFMQGRRNLQGEVKPTVLFTMAVHITVEKDPFDAYPDAHITLCRRGVTSYEIIAPEELQDPCGIVPWDNEYKAVVIAG